MRLMAAWWPGACLISHLGIEVVSAIGVWMLVCSLARYGMLYISACSWVLGFAELGLSSEVWGSEA